MFFIKKKNYLCNAEREALINRKSVDLLRRYTTRFAVIKPRKYNGVAVRQKKSLRAALVRDKESGLLA